MDTGLSFPVFLMSSGEDFKADEGSGALPAGIMGLAGAAPGTGGLGAPMAGAGAGAFAMAGLAGLGKPLGAGAGDAGLGGAGASLPIRAVGASAAANISGVNLGVVARGLADVMPGAAGAGGGGVFP